MNRVKLTAVAAALCLTAGASISAQERPIRRFTVPGLVIAAAFSPDGKNVVGWDPAGAIAWDAESGRQVGRQPLLGKACGRIATLPKTEDNRTIGVVCNGRLFMFDVGSTGSLGEWKLGEKETPILFTAAPGGSYVAAVIAGATGSLQIADRSGGKPIAVLMTTDEIEHAAFAADGSRLATGSISGVRVWSLPDGKELSRLEAAGPNMALSSDGKLLAASRNRTTVLADASTGAVQRELPGLATELRFSPDGRRLATLNNQQVVVWDVATGTQRLVLKADEFLSVSFSPDGLRLVTLSRELRGESVGTTIAIWRVPPIE